MPYSQVDLDKINAAITAGSAVQSIAFGDQTIVFRSVAEMLAVRSLILADLAAAAGAAGGTSNYRLAATSKGA